MPTIITMLYRKKLRLSNFIGNVDLGKVGNAKVQTAPCMPNQKATAIGKIVLLIIIILFCLFSCFFDAYSARWRSMICNKFFPEKAMARSQYLYTKIEAGRIHRKFQLRPIAIRKKKEQDLLEESSVGSKFKCLACLACNCCCKKDAKV